MRAAIPALVALLVSIGMQWLITSAVPADAYLFRLFRPTGGWIMSVVPALIVFVFVWTLTDLFLKYRVGRGNERDLRRPELQQLPALVAQEPTGVTLQRLRGWDQRMMVRPAGRRIVWLLRHLNAEVDTQRMHELLRHQSDLDADSASSGYRTAKLFIWAMPILGFIGTVLGISLAVGGFSEFLTTSVSIDEIDSVTAELGEVASGLSFAFDTTLLGLLAGLVATVVSSGVQEREERFVTGLDELGLRIMENSVEVGVPAAAAAPPQGAPPTAELTQAMHARLEQLSGQMEQFARSSSELISRTQQLMSGLNDASARVGDGLTTSIGSATETVDALGSKLQLMSDTLAKSVSGLNERVASSEGQVQSGLGKLQETIQRNHQHSSAAITGMQEANERLAAALSTNAHQVAQASERLHSGVQSQAATELAMSTLSASVADLADRLVGFKDAQAALAPVLNQLAGPLELRLMATPNDPHRDSRET